MTKFFKPIIIASAMLVSSTAVTTAAFAQISGVGVVNPEASIASAKALTVAYQQIETQYKAQLNEIEAREKTITGLSTSLDTNNDKQVTDQEAKANPTAIQQIQAENTAIENLTRPIIVAQMFALEQVAAQYPGAQQQVVTEKRINLLMGAGSILYVAPTLDANKEISNINTDVIAKLDVLIPFVNINVPQGWQPSRQTQALFQQIQQLRRVASARQQQAQAAGQQPAAPAQQPSGR